MDPHSEAHPPDTRNDAPDGRPTADAPIDGTAEDLTPTPEPSVELVLAPQAGAFIRADDPTEVLAKAQQIAQPLAALIEQAGLAKNLGGTRKHVEVGGWQAAGTMLGALGGQALHAETVWTRVVRDPETGEPIRRNVRVTKKGSTAEFEGFDWEARVEVRTPAGVVVGTAEAMCSRTESTWSNRDDYAVRSMAETRAESRAYRRAIGWVVHLAGYNPTPAEEVPNEAPQLTPEQERAIAYAPVLEAIAEGKQPDLARKLAVLVGVEDQPEHADVMRQLWKYLRGTGQRPPIIVAQAIDAIVASYLAVYPNAQERLTPPAQPPVEDVPEGAAA